MSGRTLLLVGAGHAHLGVIEDLLGRGLPCERVVLAEPRGAMHYSGMIPGWLAGEYRASEAMIPLEPLLEDTPIEWFKARLVALDTEARIAKFDNGEVLPFDVCSIATGGTGRAARLVGDDPRLLDIRPIDTFVETWRGLRDLAQPPRRIAVIGGGAGGVELAFGLANAPLPAPPEVMLVAGKGGLLSDHSRAASRVVGRELEAQNITVVSAEARFENGALCIAGQSVEPQDLVVAAVGSGAPDWPRQCGLPVDEDGFIRVEAYQRACGLAHIFAAGDVARRTDRDLPHSGVHAVYAGPVLADNLRRALAGKKPSAIYRGWGMDFYLLNTGRGEAIVSYGPAAFKARWLRLLKDWLDRRWIARFTRPAGP